MPVKYEQTPSTSGGIGGSIAVTQVAFGTAANTIGGDSAFIFDAVNKWLKVGSALGTIDAPLHVRSNTARIMLLEGGTTFPLYLGFKNASANDIARIQGGTVANRGGVLDVYVKINDNVQATAAAFAARWNSIGYYGLNTSNPQERLHVVGNARTDGRSMWSKGASVTAAGDLVLGTDGNTFAVAGATTVNAIDTTGWREGNIIVLYFVPGGSPTLKHNTAGGAGTAPMLLSGSVDWTTGADYTITFFFDGTSWQEIARKTP